MFIKHCNQRLVDYTNSKSTRRLNFPLKEMNFDEYWGYMANKSISEEILKGNYGVNNRPIFAPKVPTVAQFMGL